MWLHAHPVNAPARARRAPVTTLWLWGGPSGPAAPLPPRLQESPAPVPTLTLGADAYLAGLARLSRRHGAGRCPRRSTAGAVAARTVLVIELAALGADAGWSLAGALAEADRRYIAPALAALQRGPADDR